MIELPPLRALVVDANDGIVATAGIVEGFAGAGLPGQTVALASVMATVAGSLAVGGAKYAEEAAERDAELAMLDEERRQLATAPDQEIAELAAFYEGRGLDPDLARRVAEGLTAADALAAHAYAEHGLREVRPASAPYVVGVSAGGAFALGAAVPLLTTLLTPGDLSMAVTFVAVLLSLALTSVLVARHDRTEVLPMLLRSVVTGAVAMSVSLAVGTLFEP